VWALIFHHFTTVFLAELETRPNWPPFWLAAESRPAPAGFSPGLALALICSSLVGVLLGRWLASVPCRPAAGAELSGLLMVSLGLWAGLPGQPRLLQPVTPKPLISMQLRSWPPAF